MSSQKGQAIVLVALLILVLFGMLGLAVDSGRAYVDRRDLQAAVDAAALSAGDWYENYHDLYGKALPQSELQFTTDIRDYSGTSCNLPVTTFVGANFSLQQDTVDCFYPNSYHLQIVSTNTQFNGYEFQYTATHNLSLAFIQIFGGSPTALISATATAIVGNQRQTPALLTLSTACGGAANTSLELSGGATLTVVGDVYTNGCANVDPNLIVAGDCYSAVTDCNAASFYCFSGVVGQAPVKPPCPAGYTQGSSINGAPTLPDPGYLSPSQPIYNGAITAGDRGTWTEFTPGIDTFGYFTHLSSNVGCWFLDPGIYTMVNGFKNDGSGMISNELKPPDEIHFDDPTNPPGVGSGNPPPGGAYGAPYGTSGIQFWNQNSASCSGEFNVVAVPIPGHGPKNPGTWGIEVTSVRRDVFLDPSTSPDPCLPPGNCRRESSPSTCVPVAVDNNHGIDVNITRNAPGAQYYNVYANPFGCDNKQSDNPSTAPNAAYVNNESFTYVGRYLAPGWVDGGGPPATPVGPWPNLANGSPTVTLVNGENIFFPLTKCSILTVTLCDMNQLINNLPSPGNLCYSSNRGPGCEPPDQEISQKCFVNCVPTPTNLAQENAPFSLEYAPWSGGDEANENYCVPTATAGNGDPNVPCASAKVTPGAVQFYFPAGACFSQNASAGTFVFSGSQYDWIVIYQPANSPLCSDILDGSAATSFIGTIYTPSTNFEISGGNRSPLSGQVICNQAKVSGGASVGIDFNPNYSPAPPAARLIN